MHRTLAYSLDRGITADCSLDMIPSCLQEREALVWLDFEAPSDEEFEFLDRTFQFHPLALEDT